MEKAEKFKLEIDTGKLEFNVEQVNSGNEIHYKISNRGGYLFTLVPESEQGNEFAVSKEDLASNPNIDQNLVRKIADAIEDHFM